MLERFNAWFSSAWGVWQTVILVLIVVIWEQLDPHADQHGFWLLYWLTVYSAVTQPALAYIARRSGEQQEALLAAIQLVVRHIEMHEPCDCAPPAARPPGARR